MVKYRRQHRPQVERRADGLAYLLTRREPFRHGVERGAEPTEFRSRIRYSSPCIVVAGTPLGGYMKETVNGLLQKLATADNRRQCRGEDTENNQRHASYCGVVNGRKCFGL